MGETGQSAAAVTVLTVCTGNVCRSPVAARLFEAGLAKRLGRATAAGVRVGSAGTAAWAGEEMEPEAGQALAELGVDPTGHVARQLTADLVRGADLVLCAGREHRAAVVTLHPRAARRAFTLRELGRLLAGVPAGAVIGGEDLPTAFAALVSCAAARRGLVPTVGGPGQDDLADPLGLPLPAFRACAQTIADVLEVPLDLLAAGSS